MVRPARNPDSVMAYNNCCVGIYYLPAMGGLVYASLESSTLGSVILWEEAETRWP